MPERCVRYQKQEAVVKDVTAPLPIPEAVEKIKAIVMHMSDGVSGL